MSRIKAAINDDGQESSVEFSLDEVIAHHHHGTAWRDMNDDDRMSVIRDYAAWLYSRQNGRAGDLSVSVSPGALNS